MDMSHALIFSMQNICTCGICTWERMIEQMSLSADGSKERGPTVAIKCSCADDIVLMVLPLRVSVNGLRILPNSGYLGGLKYQLKYRVQYPSTGVGAVIFVMLYRQGNPDLEIIRRAS